MISNIKTGALRCPFQCYTRLVQGHKTQYKTENGQELDNVIIKEERSEFAECFKEKCMAYHKPSKTCRMNGMHMPVMFDGEEEEEN